MKWAGADVFQVTTRKDHVARLVKAAILAGKVKPGERIVELELAQDLGIGNTAVREALFELQRQGFVTRQANRGTFVTELTREDAQQIFRVRRELEGLAAELVEGRLTEADERALRQLIEAMRKTAFERDLDAFSKADLDFHQTIWRLSRNRFLEEALLTMVGPLFAVFVMRDRSVSREELLRSAQRHGDILDALIRGSGSRSVMEDSLQYFLQQQMNMTPE
jgi:DNA-binding GntR family transcriptional regulator